MEPPLWPFRRAMHCSWSRSSLGTATVFDKRHHPAKRPAGRVRMADATGNFRTRIRQKHRKSFHAFPDVMRGRGRSSLRDRPLCCARPRLCLAIVVMRAVIKQRQQNKALRCGAWAQPCRTVQNRRASSLREGSSGWPPRRGRSPQTSAAGLQRKPASCTRKKGVSSNTNPRTRRRPRNRSRGARPSLQAGNVGVGHT